MPTITPNDPNIVYSPCNWSISSGEARTINSGAYLRFVAVGAGSIGLTFAMAGIVSPAPRLAYRVDNGPWTRVPLAASVTLAIPNEWNAHRVDLVYDAESSDLAGRWTIGSNAVKLVGIVLDAGSLAPIPVATYRGVAFGDSITAGRYTISATGELVDHSALQAYSLTLAKHLDAEIGVVGFGGQGWDKTATGGVPTFADAFDDLWQGGPTRDFADVDFVTIAHGTNATSTPATAGIVAATLDDMFAVLEPGVPVFAILPWNGQRNAEIVQGVGACSDSDRVHIIDTAGWWTAADSPDALHPYGWIHTSVFAPRIAAAITGVLTAEAQPTTNAWIVNSAGVPVPLY